MAAITRQPQDEPVDLSEADDTTPEEAPPVRAAPTRGRGRGRGRVSRGRGKIAKPAPAKPAGTGRGRRHKVYESARAQAAHERIQELKSTYATIAKSVKPAVQEVADRSINLLIQDAEFHKKVPEYSEIMTFLQTRLADTKKTLDAERQIGLDMVRHVYEGQKEAIDNAHQTQLAELCDERYDQLMIQLDTLEYLHANKLPIDLPAPADDGEYLYKNISQKQFDEQGPYFEVQDGVEVPFPGKPVSELMTKEYQLPEVTSPKRKANDQPDGQPSAKLAAGGGNGETLPTLPRHVSGLLSAVEAVDERGSTPGEGSSNAPTPRAEPAEYPSPGAANNAPANAEVLPVDAQEIPLPRHTTGPDEYGVRIVSRKPTRLDIPNNRIVVPNMFEWDDLDIGFRDSANSVHRSATKAKRGKYLSKPGSNFMFIDRRVGTWDSTQSAGEFDEALVKKYGLHPTLGIVLPTSTNESEPPKPIVSGWKPVAHVSPCGQIVHASRTIPDAKRERRADEVYRKLEMKHLLRELCEREGIAADDVAPTEEERAAHRRSVFVARGIDPDSVQSPSSLSSPEIKDEQESKTQQAAEVFDNFVSSVLEDAVRTTQAKRPTTATRPYDAIRDVFTETTSTTETPVASSTVPTPQPSETKMLSLLAEAAEADRQQEPMFTRPLAEQPFENYNVAEPATNLAYPQQAEQLIQEPIRNTGDFLKTALNSPGAEYPPAPEYSRSTPVPATVLAPAPGAGRKRLPSLRPNRDAPRDGLQPPETHGSPGPYHSRMGLANNGPFGPPGPSRPVHNMYMGPEPHGLQQPYMQSHPQFMSSGPLQAPQLGHTADNYGPYRASPPPYHGSMHHGGPPMIIPQPVPSAQLSSIAPAPPPSAPSPRSRPGSSSAASSSGAAGPSAGPRFKNIQPAPTPPHRMGYAGNGQELRTVPFDPRGSIKDYDATAEPPRQGPTSIRGWAHNNVKLTGRKGDEEAS